MLLLLSLSYYWKHNLESNFGVVYEFRQPKHDVRVYEKGFKRGKTTKSFGFVLEKEQSNFVKVSKAVH